MPKSPEQFNLPGAKDQQKENSKANSEGLKLTREKLEEILAIDKAKSEEILNDRNDSNKEKYRVTNEIIGETEDCFIVEYNPHMIVYTGRSDDRRHWDSEWQRAKGSIGRGESRYYKVYKEDSMKSPLFQSEEEAIASEKKLDSIDNNLEK